MVRMLRGAHEPTGGASFRAQQRTSNPPLRKAAQPRSYDAKDKKLVVNKAEAETVIAATST